MLMAAFATFASFGSACTIVFALRRRKLPPKHKELT